MKELSICFSKLEKNQTIVRKNLMKELSSKIYCLQTIARVKFINKLYKSEITDECNCFQTPSYFFILINWTKD